MEQVAPTTRAVLTNHAVLAGYGAWGGPSDTWGISGPTFVICYLILIGVAGLAAILIRRRLAMSVRHRGQPLDRCPYLLANLVGQAKLTLWAALGALHADGLVDIENRKIVARGRADTTGRHRLERAILDELGRAAAAPAELTTRPLVRDAFTALRDELQREGLYSLDAGSGRGRWCALIMVPVVLLGVVRWGAGINAHKPTLFLVLAIIVAIVVGIVLATSEGPLRPLRDVELSRLRREHAHLAPAQRPSWPTYGPPTLALAIALFGTAALWQAAPGFASALGAPRAIGYSTWVSPGRARRTRSSGRSSGGWAGGTAGTGYGGWGGSSSCSSGGGGGGGFSGCGG